jgi:ribosome-binding factor A
MKEKIDRIRRVNEMLKREIADALEKNPFEASGPACLMSVSAVDVSPDLRHARIYISFLGGTPAIRRKAIAHLEAFRPDLQHRISTDLRLKYTPVLEFLVDRKVEEGDRVLALLDEMEQHEPSEP